MWNKNKKHPGKKHCKTFKKNNNWNIINFLYMKPMSCCKDPCGTCWCCVQVEYWSSLHTLAANWRGAWRYGDPQGCPLCHAGSPYHGCQHPSQPPECHHHVCVHHRYYIRATVKHPKLFEVLYCHNNAQSLLEML